jgi:hypothetical protein
MAAFTNAFPQENGIAQRQRELEQAVICPECGSTWFTEMTYNQYSDMAYGAGAGADLRVISIMPQTIRVCLCGHPFTPNVSGIRGRVASAEMDAFKVSLAKAHSSRKTRNQAPEGVSMDDVSKNFASLSDAEALKQQLEGVQATLNTQTRAVEDLKFRSTQLEEATKPMVGISGTTGGNFPGPVVSAEAARPVGAGEQVGLGIATLGIPTTDEDHVEVRAGRPARKKVGN